VLSLRRAGRWAARSIGRSRVIEAQGARGVRLKVRLRQLDGVSRAAAPHVDELVPGLTAGADEEAAVIVDLRINGPAHHLEAAVSAGPHGARLPSSEPMINAKTPVLTRRRALGVASTVNISCHSTGPG
jgi:hypothetical protein